MFRILSSFSRLSLVTPSTASTVSSISCRSISTASSLNFYSTPYVLGQPLRKKNRIDPNIERMKTDRRKRRLEKKIRQLEKQARLFKPVEELMPNFDLQGEQQLRMRPVVQLTPEEESRRILLLKAWTREQSRRSQADAAQLALMVRAQENALEELKEVSPKLYKAAIEPYNELFPYKGKGPSETPPIPNYEIPDGNYTDKSRKWIITASGELI